MDPMDFELLARAWPKFYPQILRLLRKEPDGPRDPKDQEDRWPTAEPRLD